MKLIIVRHGATDFNLKGIIQGQMDTDLNDQGRLQASELGLALADEPIHAIYSSDLKRSRQTTAAILQHHQHLSAIYSEFLRERHFGDLQNNTIQNLKEVLASFAGEDEQFTPKGGESLLVFHARVDRFWQMIKKEKPAGTYIVSAHGGVTKSLITHALSEGLHFRRSLIQDNCCVNILEDKNSEGFKAEKINCVAHLSQPTGREGL